MGSSSIQPVGIGSIIVEPILTRRSQWCAVSVHAIDKNVIEAAVRGMSDSEVDDDKEGVFDLDGAYTTKP